MKVGDTGRLHQLKVVLSLLRKNKGKNSNLMVREPGRHDLSQAIGVHLSSDK